MHIKGDSSVGNITPLALSMVAVCQPVLARRQTATQGVKLRAMDKNTMLQYWATVGISQLDEDLRTLQTLEPSPARDWFIQVAEEANHTFEAWLEEHHPEVIAEQKKVP